MAKHAAENATGDDINHADADIDDADGADADIDDADGADVVADANCENCGRDDIGR